MTLSSELNSTDTQTLALFKWDEAEGTQWNSQTTIETSLADFETSLCLPQGCYAADYSSESPQPNQDYFTISLTALDEMITGDADDRTSPFSLGQTDQCVGALTCADNQTPSISVVGGDEDHRSSTDESYIDQGATCHDTEDGLLSHSVEVSGAVVNMRKAGVYEIMYNCQDLCGANAPTQTRTVTIIDPCDENDEAPIITLKGGDETHPASQKEEYVDKGARCSDFIDGLLVGAVKISGDVVDMTVPGTYDLVYTCLDQCDQAASPVTRIVTITDNPGCTDPNATNHDDGATQDDGSCHYELCQDNQTLHFGYNTNHYHPMDWLALNFAQLMQYWNEFIDDHNDLDGIQLIESFTSTSSSLTVIDPNSLTSQILSWQKELIVDPFPEQNSALPTTVLIKGTEIQPANLSGDLFDSHYNAPMKFYSHATLEANHKASVSAVDESNESHPALYYQCVDPIVGCMDSQARNYNEEATVPDRSCIYSYDCPENMSPYIVNDQGFSILTGETLEEGNVPALCHCSPGYFWEDENQDNQVTTNECLLFEAMCPSCGEDQVYNEATNLCEPMTPPTCPLNGDMNNDQQVNVLDVVALINDILSDGQT